MFQLYSMKGFIIGLIILLVFTVNGFSQTDTSFWFAAPDITASHADNPIILRITALNEDATVTISQPANSSFIPITINVFSNSSQSVDLTSWLNVIENTPENTVLNKGLYIRSTKFITAYYEESSNKNPEIFVLKGRNALGTNFFIPAQNLMQNDWTRFSILPKNGFDIVATEDNTTITITPTKDVTGHTALTPFTITLNKGQTYNVTSFSNLGSNHLMGTTVLADKPIAITIKDDSLTGGGYNTCADLAGEQIIPISLIGTKYISLPGYLNSPSTQPTDNLFVLATEDNTVLKFNGIVTATINKGQTFYKPSYNEVFYIESTKPIYVLHLSGFGCEVGTALLPQLDCSGSKTVGFTRSANTPLYLNILVPNGGEGNFSLNGNTALITAASFADVPNTAGAWKYARIQISNADLVAGAAAIIKNATHDFHLGIIHGDVATGCRYGYFSGFNKFDAVSFSNANNSKPGCSGDTLKLFCDVGAAENISFSWIGPNGFTSTEKNPIIANVQTWHSGTYTVTATKLNCNTITTSTNVVVAEKPTAIAKDVSALCEGATLHLDGSASTSGASYLWTKDNLSSFSILKQVDSIMNVSVNHTGFYTLTVSKNGCTARDTINVVVNKYPDVQLSSNSPLCRLQQLQVTNSNTVANTNYSWSGPNGFSSALRDFVVNNFNYSDTGIYYVTATANNCTTKKSITVSLKEIPKIQFDSLPNVCINAPSFVMNAFEYSGIAGDDIFMVDTTPLASNIFNPANYTSGSHIVKYIFTASNGCEDSLKRPITIYPLPQISISAVNTIMIGNSTKLNTTVVGNIKNILWQPNTNMFYDTLLSPIVKPLQNTTYQIDVTTTEGCKNNNTILIKVLNSIFIPNVFSPNGDGINDKWMIDDLNEFAKCSIEVFDRDGTSVFKNTGNTIKWNGTYANKPVPTGVYYYLIYLNDGFTNTPFSGTITIVR